MSVDHPLMYNLLLQILFFTLLYLFYFYRRKEGLPLPPGPPADPIVGHLRLMPTEHQEFVFHDWGKRYGDVVHLHFLGRSVIILNSRKAAIDLLEKRSSNYSDRPRFILYDLLGWYPSLTFTSYGERFRKRRKMLHTHLTQTACMKFQSFQSENAGLLLQGLLESEYRYEFYLSRFSTALAIKVAYGHQIVSDHDEYIKLADCNATALSECGAPGGTVVDLFPFLWHFPSWFPGTHYANVARSWTWAIQKLHDFPYENVKTQLESGAADTSVLAILLEATGGRKLNHEDEEDIKGTAATIYGAGAETTWTALEIFLFTMLLYPECQRKAQEEIDRVIGGGRLPKMSDRKALPYVECLVQEVFRWHPVVAVGIPHRSLRNDIYRGMLIPEGSLIFANAMGMALDEDTYENPSDFYPSRFLPKPEGNGEPLFDATWGFGRRICPGRHLASASVWIAIASILAVLDIKRPLDEHGKEIVPERVFVTGITSRPKPFACDIKVRSAQAEQLILQASS